MYIRKERMDGDRLTHKDVYIDVFCSYFAVGSYLRGVSI